MAGWNWEVEIFGWGCSAAVSALLQGASPLFTGCAAAGWQISAPWLTWIGCCLAVPQVHHACLWVPHSQVLQSAWAATLLLHCHFSAGTGRPTVGLGSWGAVSLALKLCCVNSAVSCWSIAHNGTTQIQGKGTTQGHEYWHLGFMEMSYCSLFRNRVQSS